MGEAQDVAAREAGRDGFPLDGAGGFETRRPDAAQERFCEPESVETGRVVGC